MGSTSKSSSFQNQSGAKTPRSKVDAEIRDSGVSLGVIPKPIRNKLLFENALSEEIKVARKNTNDQEQQAIRSVISGNIIKKYRQIKVLAKMTKTERRKLSKVKAKSIKIHKLRKKPLIEKGIQAKVLEFFGRDDNSRMMPGKDAKIIEKGTPKIQKRLLNDYLSNLCDKFAAEYPEDRLSFASFCRMRQSNYLLVNFTTRTACLCTRHQNMALNLKSLKLFKIVDTQNPDVFVKKKQS